MNLSIDEPKFDLQAQNEIVAQWTSMIQTRMRQAAIIFQDGKVGTIERAKPSAHTERKLENSILGQTRQTYGVIDRASIKFERHGVFVQKGVGRGYQMQEGFVHRVAKTPMSGKIRQPADWFNSVIVEIY